jgi:hypothetical protein
MEPKGDAFTLTICNHWLLAFINSGGTFEKMIPLETDALFG